MCRPPSEQSVRAVLKTALPDVVVERIQAIPSPRLQRLYEVTISDDRTLHLVLAPSTQLRLLRSEHFMITSEATAVRWIRDTLFQDSAASQQPTDETFSFKNRLLRFIPTLIHLSPGPNELGAPCSFFEPTSGTPLALIPGLLSTQERQQVDRRVGQLFRHLAHLTSPSGRFGAAAACLSTSRQHHPSPRLLPGTGNSSSSSSSPVPTSNEGTETWSGAFHLMLEAILRDGEDMAVMISYSAIRRHFRRFRHLLDRVTVPRLVVVDGADETNILVSSSPPSLATAPASNISSKTADQQEDEDEDPDTGMSFTFTALRDFSTSLFGDPLLATVFSNSVPPSPEFLQGFNNNTTTSPIPSSSPSYPPNTNPPDLISDIESAPTRQLLYRVYHASVNIIREFYRPRGGHESSRRELEARKRLTEALAMLEGIPDETDHHHHPKRSLDGARLSGEVSPAKRVKG